MTITATDGGTIDNLRLNEFLGSVTLSGGGLLGINASLLSSVTIQATDSTSLSSTANAGQLLNVSLLGTTQPAAIIEAPRATTRSPAPRATTASTATPAPTR